jgi:hypothetical protein
MLRSVPLDEPVSPSSTSIGRALSTVATGLITSCRLAKGHLVNPPLSQTEATIRLYRICSMETTNAEESPQRKEGP